MDFAPLQTALNALAGRILKIAQDGSVSLESAAQCMTAAADIVKSMKPTRLISYTISEPTLLVSNHVIEGFQGRNVQLVVVHQGDVARVLPTALWAWNADMGKLTLLDYTFPEGSTVDLYFTL